MKVLQINSFFSVGGPPRIVKGIYETLEANGHECILAAGRERPIEGMKIIKVGTPFNKYWHLFMSRMFDAQGLSSKLATKKLVNKIDEYNPDIIQLHNLHGYYINIELLFNYLKMANKPVVWTLHDCWALTGHCTHFDYVGCDRWKTGCFDCPQINEYPTCYFVDESKRNYEKKKKAFTDVKNMTIVTPSNWLAGLVKESFLGKYSVHVINNGIDLKIFKPTENEFKKHYGIEDKIMVLGVAQNWGERKGLYDFIKLAGKLDKAYQVVMVGLTDKQIKALPKNIIAIGRTKDSTELAQIYTAADMLVNLTVEDTFPTVNLESVGCGTPVITYDTGGSPECIDESCGIVIEKGDISGLINVIENLKEKPFNNDTCILRAKKYEKTDKYKEYLALYNTFHNKPK